MKLPEEFFAIPDKLCITSFNMLNQNIYIPFLTILTSKKGDFMGMINMKTATITDKGQIAIPRDMREIDGFEEGDKIAIIAYNDHIELRPLEQVSKKLDFTKEGIRTAVLSEKSLAKIWLTKKEDEAWKNL